MANKITKLMLNGEEYEIREYQEGGWQPGANTLVYYPFKTDFNDYSGNNYNLSNYGNVSISTVDGVDCATFANSSPYGLYNNDYTIDIMKGQYTFLAWIYYVGGGTDFPRVFGGSKQDEWFILYKGNKIQPNASNTGGIQSTQNTWELIAFVGDLSNGSWDGYKNGEYVTNGTGTTGTKHGIRLGGGENNLTNFGDAFLGSISDIIFEDRQRTAQEILGYFNQTKSLYGIS